MSKRTRTAGTVRDRVARRDENSKAVFDTAHHAIALHLQAERLQAKVDRLRASSQESLRVAADMVGEIGIDVTLDHFFDVEYNLYKYDVPDREQLTRAGGTCNFLFPGKLEIRHRTETGPWPARQPVVYFLLTEDDEIIYIGRTMNLQGRMGEHAKKPWHHILIIPCATYERMCDVEGKNIFLHQPPLNKSGLARMLGWN